MSVSREKHNIPPPSIFWDGRTARLRHTDVRTLHSHSQAAQAKLGGGGAQACGGRGGRLHSSLTLSALSCTVGKSEGPFYSTVLHSGQVWGPILQHSSAQWASLRPILSCILPHSSAQWASLRAYSIRHTSAQFCTWASLSALSDPHTTESTNLHTGQSKGHYFLNVFLRAYLHTSTQFCTVGNPEGPFYPAYFSTILHSGQPWGTILSCILQHNSALGNPEGPFYPAHFHTIQHSGQAWGPILSCTLQHNSAQWATLRDHSNLHTFQHNSAQWASRKAQSIMHNLAQFFTVVESMETISWDSSALFCTVGESEGPFYLANFNTIRHSGLS